MSNIEGKEKIYLCAGHTLPGDKEIRDVNQSGEKSNELIPGSTEKKTLFSDFLYKTPNLAWMVDEELNLVFASNTFYQYFGLDEKKFL